MPSATPSARYDLPWKAALTHAFRAFIAFFFPDLCSQIDWRVRPRFCDKELAGIGFGDAPGVMVADKLVEVALRDGGAHWLLIHIEVQAQHDPAALYAAEWQSTRLLFEHGWSKRRIMALFKAANWMMVLPAPLQQRYWRAIVRLDKEQNMNIMEWVTPLEQMFIDKGQKKGLKKGLQQGLEQGRELGLEQGRREGARVILERQLAQRFGPLPKTIRSKLAKASMAQLEAWSDGLQQAESLKQLFA